MPLEQLQPIPQFLPPDPLKWESLIHIYFSSYFSAHSNRSPKSSLFYTILSLAQLIGPICQFCKKRERRSRGEWGTPISGGSGDRNESLSSIGDQIRLRLELRLKPWAPKRRIGGQMRCAKSIVVELLKCESWFQELKALPNGILDS
jgi:hypothetical protein